MKKALEIILRVLLIFAVPWTAYHVVVGIIQMFN